VHQWLKNLLVFVPLLAAHRVLDSTLLAVLAFAAFSLCASGVYLLNDLLDLKSDRRHHSKRNRPLAAGKLPLLGGLLAAPVLTLAAFAVALAVSPLFALVLGGYWLTTLAYSLQLKRKVMLDVLLLAALYTARIIGGAVAIMVEPSFWLLAFSMFMFLSLALLKRYTELAALLADGRDKASGRGYRVDDLPLLQSFGAASGYGAVLVLALYINSPESLELYTRPYALWLLCPMLLYWISRAWFVAHRGEMHDDPVVYAATDRFSLGVATVGGLVLLAAL
jgi:4-hydroxybenzoate polyprenyltransferase